MFSVDSSDLNIVFFGYFFEFAPVLAQSWKSDVNGGPETSSEVGWASCDISEMSIVSKFSLSFDFFLSFGKSREDSLDISSFLHRNDSKLIFFVDPNEECFGVIMENTSSRRPVSSQAASLQESVPHFEQKVVLDELFLDFWLHSFQRVKLSLEFSGECLKSVDRLLFYLFSLLFRNLRS